MKVINLTAHDVNICDYYGNLIKVYKPSGLVARVDYGWNRTDYVDDVPIITQKDTKIVELPEPMEDVMFIVSSYYSITVVNAWTFSLRHIKSKSMEE